MTPLPDNALTALERARQAQERHERRIDVQLRLGLTEPDDGNPPGRSRYPAQPASGSVKP